MMWYFIIKAQPVQSASLLHRKFLKTALEVILFSKRWPTTLPRSSETIFLSLSWDPMSNWFSQSAHRETESSRLAFIWPPWLLGWESGKRNKQAFYKPWIGDRKIIEFKFQLQQNQLWNLSYLPLLSLGTCTRAGVCHAFARQFTPHTFTEHLLSASHWVGTTGSEIKR